MAKPIDPKKIRRSRDLPTTGDGSNSSQKPKVSETNLPGKRGGFIAPLLRRVLGGKHQGR